MSQSSIVKTVGGLTTKITTMTTKVTSSSQQKIQQQQQQQTKQQVTTKPQHKTEARMENHTSVRNMKNKNIKFLFKVVVDLVHLGRTLASRKINKISITKYRLRHRK